MEHDEPAPVLLPCPVCGELTDGLKQYRYVNWCVFLLVGAVYRAVVYRACPGCMRQFLWQRCLYNAIPANVVWLIGLLPWGLCLIAASHRTGHSRAVVRGVTPEMAVARETAQQELSWARVAAILSVLLFWLPVLGLVVGAAVYWLNRRSTNWTYRVTQVAFAASVMVHVGLVGMVVAEAAQR